MTTCEQHEGQDQSEKNKKITSLRDEALTLVVPEVVSAFDSAPSLSKTDVRFKPLKRKQRGN